MLAIAKSVHDWQIRQKRKADDMNAPVPEEFVAHVPVPTKDQLEKMILDKRKEVYFSSILCFWIITNYYAQELMKRYVSAEVAETIIPK